MIGYYLIQYWIQKIYGAIIPHHDLVSSYIAELFDRLSLKENPKTIFILGPNHAGFGSTVVISGRVLWKTSYKNTVAFVSFYFPDSKIVPLVKINNKEMSNLEKMADKLSDYLKSDEALFIGLFDFSHYLTPQGE